MQPSTAQHVAASANSNDGGVFMHACMSGNKPGSCANAGSCAKYWGSNVVAKAELGAVGRHTAPAGTFEAHSNAARLPLPPPAPA